jgi:gliding motility-associated-like protein
MKDNRIEELFKNGLLDSESDVPAGTWKAIENSLDTMLPVAGAASQPTGGPGTLVKTLVGGLIVSGITLSVYLFYSEKETPVSELPVVAKNAAVGLVDPGKMEKVAETSKPSSPNRSAVISLPDKKEEEQGWVEVFTAKDEITPLSVQKNKEEKTAEESLSETLSESKNPVDESNTPEAAVPEHALNEMSQVSEPDVAETSLLADVSFNDVITPNLDNVNDIFRVESNEAVASFTVTVMNLNGKVIHQWSAANGFWDGRLENGQMAPSGKYLVDIFVQPLKGTPYHKPVTIQLIR